MRRRGYAKTLPTPDEKGRSRCESLGPPQPQVDPKSRRIPLGCLGDPWPSSLGRLQVLTPTNLGVRLPNLSGIRFLC
jgi:hypothetical protein